jgi:hypothetical protein
VRAIGLTLAGRADRAQVSCNVEEPDRLPLAELVVAVARLAPIAAAELVGLAPRAAFDGFPAALPMPGFDPNRQIIENVLDPVADS